MKLRCVAFAAVVMSAVVSNAWAQPAHESAIPIRISWSELNQDGYAQATFINDSSQRVNDAAFHALLAEATKTAGIYVTECRRHLNPGPAR